MKRLKLILATIVAVFAAFTGGKALAYDITVNNGGNGTYESYQIFTGDLSGDTLSNIKWGTGISTEGQTALQNKYSATSAEKLAEKLATFSTGEAEAFAKEAAKYLQNPGALTSLVAGYYLVQNKTVGTNEAYTNYILKVIKNVTVTPKTDVPTVVKKVKDTNDTTGVTSDWQDSADHDINDKVPFQLTATLPANYDSYNSYYLNFSDELSAGLTFNNDVEVYVVNGETETKVTNYFYRNEVNSQLTVAIQDLKQIAVDGTATITKDSKIVVRYSATLNKDAVIGSKGNPNTVELIYSNNPNNSGDGSQKPNTPPTTPPTPPTETGKTPKDTVIVFTYKTVVNKVDQDKQPLTGAEFTLSKKMKDGSLKEVAVVKNDAGTQFSFKGLDAGDYVLKETKTPAGYNTIKDITFTVEAGHETESDAPKLTNLTGVAASGEITFNRDAANEDALTTTV